MYYNWWDDGVVERMPRVRFGQIHVVNNLFSSGNSNYCVRAGVEADILVEANAFVGVNDPLDIYDSNVNVTMKDNLFSGCSGNTSGQGTSFTPPYTMPVADASTVESAVRSCAGATLGDPR